MMQKINIINRYRGSLLMALLLSWGMVNAQYKYDSTRVNTIRWTPTPKEVTGIDQVEVDLSGEWDFKPKADCSLSEIGVSSGWQKIQVPGEWVMQGFEVAKGEKAIFRRIFPYQNAWQRKRIKLRFEAVYSEAEIWLNGKKVGDHFTGFTPFEFDASDYLVKGNNSLVVAVKSESTADVLSSGSKYAVHPLCGISRPVKLLVLPEKNIGSLHVFTTFDKEYKDAVLKVETKLFNESAENAHFSLSYCLLDAAGQKVSEFSEEMIQLSKGADKKIVTEINIEKPRKWDPERPYLYSLACSLKEGEKTLEKVTRPVGFRQIEVRGNQVFVNNRVIKLRGVNRHEVHPKTGRVLGGNQWFEDVELFRQANVNYIRTSHYPPSEKLLEACDKLGMFVEVEAPFCWASEKVITDANYFDQILRPTLEMVEQLKSHPSILHWSMANESHNFNELFKESARLVKKADPTRPRIFSQWGPDSDGGFLELANHHYPGPDAASKYKNHKRPITFDEYLHLNAYNRKELTTDPGVRDYWGELLHDMWEKMYSTPAILGGAIWAGIDDTFFLPDGSPVGYGTWGPLDGWRRKKPEYWHMKKAYSPVKVKFLDYSGSQARVLIENRHLFINLEKVSVIWKTDSSEGVLNPDIEPGKKDTVRINLEKEGLSSLTMEIWAPEKEYLVDTYKWSLCSSPQVKWNTSTGKFKWKQKGDELQIQDGEKTYGLNLKTGYFQASTDKGALIQGSPQLMVLPLTGDGSGVQMTPETPTFKIYSPVCAHRTIENVVVDTKRQDIVIRITESYDEAVGYQEIHLKPGGEMRVSYDYAMRTNINPRQVGMVFDLPESFNSLSWSRKGFWSTYPEDHIGRLEGEAHLENEWPQCGLAGPSSKPKWEWKDDRNAYGSNDFRSTKRNIYQASLMDDTGKGIMAVSDGIHHVRSWKEQNRIHLLIAEYDNPGGERFLRYSGPRSHATIWDRPLKKGDRISGTITIKLK